MLYLALLRGINVGGKNKVPMAQLKATFARLGASQVQTYIASGNVLFLHKQTSKDKLVTLLEQAILTDFNLHIRVVVRTLVEMKKIIDSLPKTTLSEQKSRILFLWKEVDQKAILTSLPIKPVDRVSYVKGAVLWIVQEKDYLKSGLLDLPKKAIYKQMTLRNIRTTHKLFSLLQEIKEKR